MDNVPSAHTFTPFHPPIFWNRETVVDSGLGLVPRIRKRGAIEGANNKTTGVTVLLESGGQKISVIVFVTGKVQEPCIQAWGGETGRMAMLKPMKDSFGEGLVRDLGGQLGKQLHVER